MPARAAAGPTTRPIPTEAFAVRFALKPHPCGECTDENASTLTLSRKPVKSNLVIFERKVFEKIDDAEWLRFFDINVCSPLSSAINGAALRVDGGVVRACF